MGVWVGVGVGVCATVAVAVGVCVAVAVAVGVAVGDAVAVGVGLAQPPLPIKILSIRTPGAATASSLPIRKRNVTVCPTRFGPRFITVQM